MTIKKRWGEGSVFIIINEDGEETQVCDTEQQAGDEIQVLIDDGVDENNISVYEARLLDFSVETKVSLREDC